MTQEGSALIPAGDGRMSFGQTNLRPQDIVPPRVKVCQQLSQEVSDKKAEAGDLFNTLTGENYGPAINIQPIVPFMQRILLVRANKRADIEEALGAELPPGDGLMCRSFDMIHGRGNPGILCDTCPLSQWDEVTRNPPLCTETYNVAAMNEIGELIIVSFQKSSAKIGKRLFSAMRMRPGAPWSSIFQIKTRQERNDLGVFYVPDFTIAKERPDTAQMSQALHWAEQLQGVVLDVTPEDEDSPRGNAEPVSAEAPF